MLAHSSLVCRLVMLLAGANTIRDVIAFPKSTQVSLSNISAAQNLSQHGLSSDQE